MDRRLAEIPTEEWADLQIDITPREYVLDYLSHSFPIQLFEEYSDDEGNLASRPVFDATAIRSCRREAVERRDRMIEHLASLPPVPGALDQILHRFGADQVAEVTGRSRRILRKSAATASTAWPSRTAPDRPISPRRRPSWMTTSASWCSPTPAAPAAATMRISACRNQRRRVHYLLEAGLARRRRHPGARPLEPHQPGAAAAVSSRRDRRQGREALPVDDRAPPRHARRHHPRPAPDRRARPVPRRRQSGKRPTPATRCASSTMLLFCRQGRGLLADRVSGRDRPRP